MPFKFYINFKLNVQTYCQTSNSMNSWFLYLLYLYNILKLYVGALICGMDQTVKGILENFLHLVNKYGYVLTRNRVYYEGRSQPPLLVQMMATYYMYTKDQQFLIDNIKVYNSFFLINVIVMIILYGSK